MNYSDSVKKIINDILTNFNILTVRKSDYNEYEFKFNNDTYTVSFTRGNSLSDSDYLLKNGKLMSENGKVQDIYTKAQDKTTTISPRLSAEILKKDMNK